MCAFEYISCSCMCTCTHLCSQTQHLLHQLLCVCGALQEQLHNGCQELELNLSVLILEAFQEALKQLISVVNPLGIFAYNPDH